MFWDCLEKKARFAPCPVGHNFYVKHVLARIGAYWAMVCGFLGWLCFMAWDTVLESLFFGTVSVNSWVHYVRSLSNIDRLWPVTRAGVHDFLGPSQSTREFMSWGYSIKCCFFAAWDTSRECHFSTTVSVKSWVFDLGSRNKVVCGLRHQPGVQIL